MFSRGLFITKAEEYVGDGGEDVLETPQMRLVAQRLFALSR